MQARASETLRCGGVEGRFLIPHKAEIVSCRLPLHNDPTLHPRLHEVGFVAVGILLVDADQIGNALSRNDGSLADVEFEPARLEGDQERCSVELSNSLPFLAGSTISPATWRNRILRVSKTKASLHVPTLVSDDIVLMRTEQLHDHLEVGHVLVDLLHRDQIESGNDLCDVEQRFPAGVATDSIGCRRNPGHSRSRGEKSLACC
jgi:hypothetical protein